jgi:hypothetical protein
MHRIGRLCFVAAAVAATLVLPGSLGSPASAAATRVKPTITTTEASFAIPAGSQQAWLIRLWTLPKPSTLEGHAIGSSGTISVPVPTTSNCEFQVDVLVGPAGATKGAQFTWYSGLVATVAGCGPHCPTSGGGHIVMKGSGTHVKPTIDNIEATFTIPSGPAQAWVIRLWTLPKPSTLVGQTFGSSGTLTVNVPLTQTCQFQVDVKVAPVGTTNPNDFTWYSGLTATV